MIVAVAENFEDPAALTHSDPRGNRNGLLSLGSFHGKLVADRELDALRHRDELFSDS